MNSHQNGAASEQSLCFRSGLPALHRFFEPLRLFLFACALSPILSAELVRAQFVDLKAEVEMSGWGPNGVRTRTTEIHCVVGTNSWQMEGEFMANARVKYFFTGTNLVEDMVVTKGIPEEVAARVDQPGMPFGSAPPVGHRSTRSLDSLDGNPGQTVRQSDQMTMPARIAWLAFCSGPCLKREDRAIYPPNDLWKEMILAKHFADRTTVFEDDLGLPRSIDLFTTNNQPVMQYRVANSTNVLGWEFPLEFYLAQYQPARVPGTNWITGGTRGWELDFVAKGTLKAISESSELLRPKGSSAATTPQKN